MTVLGALLTALVVAREWEQGTFEALFVTPVRAGEILLGKVVPYLALGIFGLVLCLLAAKFLFEVPFRGSLWVLSLSSLLYLLVALGLGLLISSAVKSQFVAGPYNGRGWIPASADALRVYLRYYQPASGDPASHLYRSCTVLCRIASDDSAGRRCLGGDSAESWRCWPLSQPCYSL